MTTEPIPSALPPGPTGATGAQPGPNGDLRWHDAAGKDLGVVQNAPAEDDFASAGHPVPSASSDDFASAGVAADEFANAGHPAAPPVNNNPYRGASEATSIGPREHGNISDSMFARFFRGGASASDVAAAHTWLEDLQSDVKNGTGSTSVGRLLQHMGAKGTSSGNPEEVGNIMAGPLLGLPQIEEGGMLAAEGHPVKAANKIFSGVGTTLGPLAVSQPEALPFIGAGMIGQHAGTEVAKGVGLDDETSELVGNVTGLLTGGLTTEHGMAALDKGVDTSKQVAARVAEKVKNTANSALGKTSDFDTAIRRISEPTKKQYGGYVEKLENVRSDLQSILNSDPNIDSPAKFAEAIDSHIQSQNAELAARAGATKESAEPVVPNIMQRIDTKLDEFFDENKGRYGSPEQVEAAKQKVRERIMQEKGAKEEGDPLARREPNLFESENIRKGLNDISKPPLGMPVGADQAAAMIGGTELRNAIDESYTTKGIDNVKEFRQKQADLIDVREKIAEAQKKADDLGQPGIIKSLMKKIGVPTSVIAIAMGHPVSAAAVGAAVLGDVVHGNLTNPLSNLSRATELASRNPGAEATNIEHTVPSAGPAAPGVPQAEIPPAIDHDLHAELATFFNSTLEKTDPAELENRFLDGLRKKNAEAEATGKNLVLSPEEKDILGTINASKAKGRQAAYDEQVKLAEAQKATAEKQAIEAQKAAAKAEEERKAQAEEAQKKQAEAALAAKEQDQARDASEDENETTRTVMEDHILPHKYEVSVADPDVEGGSRSQVVTAYSHKNALDNAMLIEKYRGNQTPDISIKQELPREEQDYHVPVDKLARMPASPSGKTALATIKHELGHVLVSHLNGVDPESIISHKHELLSDGSGRAAALIDDSKWQEKDGSYSRKSVGNNLPKLIENWMAGHAADELFNGIDRDSNPSTADRKQVAKVLKGFGLSSGEADGIIDGAIDRAKEKLDHPVTRGIIQENAPYREEGLAPSHHYSPERIERLKIEHDKRMAEHEFKQRQAEEREKEAAGEEGSGAKAAGANERAVDQAVRGGQQGLESEGQARDRGKAAQGVSEAEGRGLGKAADREELDLNQHDTEPRRSRVELPNPDAVEESRYEPSEKAQTMSAARKDYGKEFDAAQSQHEIDRNKGIIRNPKATPEDIEAARKNLFELQNPDLHEATVLTDEEESKLPERTVGNPEHDEAIRQGGGRPAGLFGRLEDPNHVKMFHDMKNGTTLGFGPGETVSAENTAKKIAASRADYAAADQRKAAGKTEWAKNAAESAKTGGFTINPRTGEVPDTGYQVETRPDLRTELDHPPTESDIRKFASANKQLLDSNPNYHVGGYGNELNISERFENRDEAVAAGKKHNQISIWNNARGEEIPTGGTGARLEPPTPPQGGPQTEPYSGVHYSPVPAENGVLAGANRGKALAGEEKARLQHENAVPGVYAYREGAKPESQIASRQHAYDIKGDKAIANIGEGGAEAPLFQKALNDALAKYKAAGDNDYIAGQKATNDAEAAIRDAGYHGYESDRYPGSTFLFGDQNATERAKPSVMADKEDSTQVRPKGSSVELQNNPLKVKGTSESGAPTTVDVAQALNKFSRKQNPALELGKAEPAAMVERAKSLAEDEAKYQLAQNNTGQAWYTADMKIHDDVLREMRPELADPNKLSMFKMVEAVLSSGQKPYGNFKAAVKAWDAYHETGKFPPTNPDTGKSWGPRGAAGYGNAIEAVNRLIAEKGEEGASKWLLSDHTVKELKDYNQNVSGKANDTVPGATILGPKRGPFAQNLHGLESAFTADMWVSRTWNRWMGTIEPDLSEEGKLATDSPRSDKERNLMKQSFSETADKLKMSTSALQAVLWYYEQALYTAHGSAKESWSFSDAAKRARDEEDSSFKFGNNATEVK